VQVARRRLRTTPCAAQGGRETAKCRRSGHLQLPDFCVAAAVPAGGVPQVDDERGLVYEPVVVDRRVGGDDRNAVVRGGVERHRRQAVLGQLGDVRVVVGDLRAGVPQESDQLEGRRL